MKHEIITIQDAQIIGISKEIAYGKGAEECPKFWGEYVERIVKPVYFEKQTPDTLQQAAIKNNVGEFGLCTCDVPGHNCMKCPIDFAGKQGSFTYVIGGQYLGGNVPEGMRLFPLLSGKWLKMHFEGGMKAFQNQYQEFAKEWLPNHPEFKIASDGQCLEWYNGTDINDPSYQCGIMLPLA